MSSKSYCVKVCKYDETESYCIGCSRTPEEITEWFYADPERKREIVKNIKARNKARKDGYEGKEVITKSEEEGRKET